MKCNYSCDQCIAPSTRWRTDCADCECTGDRHGAFPTDHFPINRGGHHCCICPSSTLIPNLETTITVYLPAKSLGSIFAGQKVIPQSMSLGSRAKIVSVRDSLAGPASFSPLHRGPIADALFAGESPCTGDRWLSLKRSARISRCDAMREMRNPPLFGLVCCSRASQHTRGGRASAASCRWRRVPTEVAAKRTRAASRTVLFRANGATQPERKISARTSKLHLTRRVASDRVGRVAAAGDCRGRPAARETRPDGVPRR